MANFKEEKTEVPVSSLIDVVFLLIMFFVVTANIDKEAYDVPVELVKSKNMKPVTNIPPQRVTINISKSGDKGQNADFFIGSALVPKQHLQAALNGVAQSFGKSTMVMIRCDKDVLFEHESLVIEAIKASGLSEIRIQAEKE